MRVVFARLLKMADHFFTEEALLAALLPSVREAGHEAHVVEYLFERDRPEGPQLAELRAALEALEPDVVFGWRWWSPSLATGLAGLPLVSLGDAILAGMPGVDGHVGWTREAVLGRLDGTPQLVPLRKPSNLQLLDTPTYDFRPGRAVSRSRSNPTRAVVLANVGCRYRVAPNRTGLFDDVELPPGVHVDGCTFCSAPRYLPMSDEQAVRITATQIAAALRDRPGLTEIAVKDDYMLGRLGLLMEALEGVEVGGVALLFSGRADHVLRYRESIEAVLSRPGPALGMYLTGLENFSQVELDRFNKGITVERTEEAVELLRTWSQRFPGRFVLRQGAGMILFTPWTTPSDLTANAAAFRRLDIQQIRGGALQSQLRLYPDRPLYWLARRDGLLEGGAWEDGDAERRGYEQDHRWRFADPAVAAIHAELLTAAGEPEERQLWILERALARLDGRPPPPEPPQTRRQRQVRLVVQPGELTAPSAPELEAIVARVGPIEGVELVVDGRAAPTIAGLAALVAALRGVDALTVEPPPGLLGELDPAALAPARLRVRVPPNRAGTAALKQALRLATACPVELDVTVRDGDWLPGVVRHVARAGRELVVRVGVEPGAPLSEVTRALAAAARLAEAAGIPLVARPRENLPPCLHPDPQAVRALLRLETRDPGQHLRSAACDGCALADVCPGLPERLKPLLAALRPLPTSTRGALGVAP